MRRQRQRTWHIRRTGVPTPTGQRRWDRACQLLLQGAINPPVPPDAPVPEADPLAAFPNLKRLFEMVDARPAVARARAVDAAQDFKKLNDEETRRALFPSNYPRAA